MRRNTTKHKHLHWVEWRQGTSLTRFDYGEVEPRNEPSDIRSYRLHRGSGCHRPHLPQGWMAYSWSQETSNLTGSHWIAHGGLSCLGVMHGTVILCSVCMASMSTNYCRAEYQKILLIERQLCRFGLGHLREQNIKTRGWWTDPSGQDSLQDRHKHEWMTRPTHKYPQGKVCPSLRSWWVVSVGLGWTWPSPVWVYVCTYVSWMWGSMCCVGMYGRKYQWV